MQKIVECVPNFSEGKDLKTINSIFDAAKSVKSVRVFELEYNKDHNRCLFTIVGKPEDVLSSAYESIKTATKLIDMEKHKGEHPRIGATDVVPFTPVSGVAMEECVELANKLGKKVGEELGIPVFLYEEAAARPENRNLADVRKGEYEGLKVKMNKPDFGPSEMHPTAGAVVVGARKYLVAFNVNLDTHDIEIAKKIAGVIREKNGGLAGLKALGFEVDGMAQVSMNLVDYEKNNFDDAYRAVETEAGKMGITIKSSEIYGMIPLESLVGAVKTTFKADTFKSDQVLEKRLYE
ncbi:MAG: Glutamate formiminotransferase [Microgenomates group bacterium GW2011_GWC1_43_13]|uniref:glutamate formimidoyltransferase n=2 Tax=Candidatus Woeseibacteriota TaxID=1752722 RepID=A0A837IF61_9BACT|nr:MAG: Glutamate formiminotransferase [Microgenomates group bacterium GW2011_GWC1_43_13]KKT33229.1 MAG: Glutamate formiminotransferase [Candidatus Woesebacteria bacterium GW2011_GWB1_44_11]KKT54369.1 MAG: Glutamate formiminotransferase [Candidatus Woesebacteria bacterium GW2011_GWA1_44_23]OGM76602.1 MAG: glutamate formimidoyltransferase [Candidatus Woesebacteria bacterium RIFOXYA1_FULL_43_16]OGM82626.1 MAG: glutamate formimidoyltransferase [Candidatus Woesebacteria bacterium RIFOXYB1_FULL_42_3